jgi:Protein of unknown function (DUF5818)
MRRNIPLLTLTIAVLLAPFGNSQTAQKPRLPNIPSNELIAWTQQQAPRPVEGQYETQKRPAAQTFAGIIVKSGEKYVLTTSDNVIYELDDQERARRFEGKQVQVTGNLDKSSNMITVRDIKAAA